MMGLEDLEARLRELAQMQAAYKYWSDAAAASVQSGHVATARECIIGQPTSRVWMRQASEPLVTADVAAYLTDWFAR